MLLGLIFTGLLLGNLISYIFDPLNYLGGFGVLFRISKGSTYSIVSYSSIYRLTFTYIHLLLLAFISIALIQAWKKIDYILFFFFILGTILFFAYYVISWAEDPRYYAPSLIIYLAGAVIAYGYLSSDNTRLFLWGISFVLLITTSYHVVQDRNNIHLYLTLGHQNATSIQIYSIHSDCIRFMSAGEAFGQETDFIATSLSPEDAASLAAKYSKNIC